MESTVLAFLEEVAEALRSQATAGVRLLGPAPAPVAKIKHLYRFHLQLRCMSPKPLQRLLHSVLPDVAPPHGVELAVDVDPVSML
jgi:primosomal protein N' (replication factor Y)